jgi:hypothetical protein
MQSEVRHSRCVPPWFFSQWSAKAPSPPGDLFPRLERIHPGRGQGNWWAAHQLEPQVPEAEEIMAAIPEKGVIYPPLWQA